MKLLEKVENIFISNQKVRKTTDITDYRIALKLYERREKCVYTALIKEPNKSSFTYKTTKRQTQAHICRIAFL